MIVFGCFTDYSLRTVVIQLHIYFTDWFCAVKFDLKLGGKNRTEDNLTDYTYFSYILTSYFDEFDFRGS